MQRITVKQANIKPSLYRAIKKHALNDFYRLNTTSANLYTFDIDLDGKSWGGGWSWLEYPKTWNGSLAIDLTNGKLYELTN